MDTSNVLLLIFLLFIMGLSAYFLCSLKEETGTPEADCVPQTYFPCEECKHLVNRSHLQVVRVINLSVFQMGTDVRYFCPEHKKPYDKVVDYIPRKKYFTEREIEVSEDGTPIGYKKIKK